MSGELVAIAVLVAVLSAVILWPLERRRDRMRCRR